MFQWIVHDRAIAAILDRGWRRAAPFARDLAALCDDTLAVMSSDRIEFIDTQPTPPLRRPRKPLTGSWQRCAASCDGTTLLAARNQGCVEAYSARRARLARQFDVELNRVDVLVACPTNPALFFTAGADGPARIHDLRTGRVMLELDRHSDQAVTSAAWSPDGRSLAVASTSSVHIFDSQNGSEQQRYPLQIPQAIAFCPTGESLYIADATGGLSAVRPWNNHVELHAHHATNDDEPPAVTVALAASRDGAHVVRAQSDGTLTWFSTITLQATRRLSFDANIHSVVHALDHGSLWVLGALGAVHRASEHEPSFATGGPIESIELRENSLRVQRFDGSLTTARREDERWMTTDPSSERSAAMRASDVRAALEALHSVAPPETAAAGGRRARATRDGSIELSLDGFISVRALCRCSLPVHHMKLSPDGAWLVIADIAGAVAIIDCRLAQSLSGPRKSPSA